MTVKEKIEALSLVGEAMANGYFSNLVQPAYQQNGWFTPANIAFATEQWAELLQAKKIESWVSKYELAATNSKNVGLVMAGNIPFAGLHDMISVLVAGHRAVIKCSSKDTVLMRGVADFLTANAKCFSNAIQFETNTLRDCDAIIATGNDNSARYFEYYFKNKRHVLRKNRNGVAVLSGKETDQEIKGLGKDVFTYFGLGCRNVSKLFVPRGYDFNQVFKQFYDWKEIAQHNKYFSNYEYNKTVYLLNQEPLLENGFLVLRETQELSSPVGVLFYEYYDDEVALKDQLKAMASKIQCIVSSTDLTENNLFTPFGNAQCPSLADYPDGIDTLSFLSTIN